MTTTLQQTMPVYHFHEQHSRLISAPPDVVWQALTTLTLKDLSITRPLIALRNVGGYRTSSAKPLLTNGPAPIFDLDPPRYTIGGSVSRPWQLRPERRTVASIDEFAAFDEPGWVKYLVDFALTREGDATRLSTETRGYSTNDHARRVFRFYWAAIRLGSAAVRRDVLASIARASASARAAAGVSTSTVPNSTRT
ncbi:MAG TPA: hypothetical protein VE623_07785 [Acidimicrobiales bacterium]|jgi:hypothetical protein|nr:hypothetical protein [Acidimicrobiales bacterium]